jgi:hypothetical protein
VVSAGVLFVTGTRAAGRICGFSGAGDLFHVFVTGYGFFLNPGIVELCATALALGAARGVVAARGGAEKQQHEGPGGVGSLPTSPAFGSRISFGMLDIRGALWHCWDLSRLRR